MKTGIIQKIESDWRSGLAEIYFDNGENIAVESGYGLRNLIEGLDGNPIGKKIFYNMDEFGIMSSFQKSL